MTKQMLTAIGNTLAAQEDVTIEQLTDRLTVELVGRWGGAWGIRDAVSGRYGFGTRGQAVVDEACRPS